tara:strand:+ start:302 stop:1006 length:705 start_codon:yes stop_codon:yes gene_type:complete
MGNEDLKKVVAEAFLIALDEARPMTNQEYGGEVHDIKHANPPKPGGGRLPVHAPEKHIKKALKKGQRRGAKRLSPEEQKKLGNKTWSKDIENKEQLGGFLSKTGRGSEEDIEDTARAVAQGKTPPATRVRQIGAPDQQGGGRYRNTASRVTGGEGAEFIDVDLKRRSDWGPEARKAGLTTLSPPERLARRLKSGTMPKKGYRDTRTHSHAQQRSTVEQIKNAVLNYLNEGRPKH